MNFCTNSVRLLRKLDHVLLWILSNETRLLQCSLCAEQRKFQWLAMFCLYTLPLARPAQAKIQMLTTSSWIVTILLKSLGLLYFKITGKAQTPNISQMCCRIKILSAFGLFNFHCESLISALNYKCRKCKYNFREDLASL